MESLHNLINDILANNPSPGTLCIALSRLKDDGRISEVIKESNKALGVYPDNIMIMKILAESYIDSGQISLAEDLIAKITEKLENLTAIYKTQADLYNRQNRKNEAIKALQIYLTHKPDDKEAIEQLANLEAGKKELEDLITAEDEEVLPEIATPTLAEIYLNQGQLTKAIETYENIIERNPEDEQSIIRLNELKTQFQTDENQSEGTPNKGKLAKEKMISTLDNWLINIRKKVEMTG